jgi:hypothetical protein
MRGMEARWQGLNSTLIMPQRKQPRPPSSNPCPIHELTARKIWSID